MNRILLLFTMSTILFLSSCTSLQSGFCSARGGQPYINLGGYQYCGDKYPDGGKLCHSSEECEGECVLPVTWNPEDGEEVLGRCRSDNTWEVGYGCLAIENYEQRSECIEE